MNSPRAARRLEHRLVVGDHEIGPNRPPLFLADIGTFFNQDTATALRLVDAVSDAGLSFVKGELLHDPDVCLPTDLMETVTTRDAEVAQESYRSIIERKVVPLETYSEIFSHARSRGLSLALSVYDFEGLDFACDLGVELLKVASSNVVHHPLIARAAQTRTPVVMDTGLATLEEVTRAVRWFVDAGGSSLVLEHSPPAPPAPPALHNLRFMRTLRDAFGCPVGLSDHHAGAEMLYAAIALGADVVEKGISPDEVVLDQDLAHSLPVSELADVSRRCVAVFDALGDETPDLQPDRRTHPARMGILAARELPEGTVLEPDDLTYAFPAVGIGVEEVDRVVGRRLTRRVASRAPLNWDDVSA